MCNNRAKNHARISALLILLSMSRDLDIAAFVLPAPRFAFLGPLAALIMKTALLALIQLLIFLLDYFDYVF